MALDQAQPAGRFAGARRIRLETWHWPLIAGLVACLFTQLDPPKLLTDGDTQMHITVGRWILTHYAIPFRDVFSYTFAGREWVPQEWGAEVIFAFVYDRLGWGGVVATTELAIFASFAFLPHALLRYFVPGRAAMGGLLAFTVPEPHLLARPHILALPFLTLWVSALIAARDEGRVPSLKLLPLMILWANLHGGFIVGLGFAGLLGLEAVVESAKAERIATARRWGGFVVLAALCSLATPNGFSVYLMTLHLLQASFLVNLIGEWQAVEFAPYQPVEVWIAAFVLVALSTGLRVKWTPAVILVLLVHLAFSHVRNVELLGFIAVLLVAKPLSEQLRKLEGTGTPVRSALPAPRAAYGVAVLIALAFFITTVLYDRAGFKPDEPNAPASALQAARAAGLNGPVLNNSNFGGSLHFSGLTVSLDRPAELLCYA